VGGFLQCAQRQQPALYEFSTNFTTLPTISFVIPNLNDDMHDGTISQADTWLQNNRGAYVQFVKTNNSLLIVTWDEDYCTSSNHIPTIFFGMPVKQVSLARPLTSKRFASTGSLGR
jgi:hypothetical protein